MSGFDATARGLALRSQSSAAAVARRVRQLGPANSRYRLAPWPASAQGATITSQNALASATATGTINGTAYLWNAPQFAWDGGRISYLGTTPALNAASATIGRSGGLPAHVSYGAATRGANPYRLRILTDAPGFMLHIVANVGTEMRPVILVDGELLSYGAATGVLTRTASYARDLLAVQFDAVPTLNEMLNANPGIATAGSGYAIGDIVTLVGGTGGVATAIVRGVTGSGGVLYLGTLTRGTYSATPAGALTTTTTGAGSGLTVTAPLWRKLRHVKMRTIEIHASAYLELVGISVGANYDVFPAPAAGPRMLVLGDSFSESSAPDDVSHLWHQQMARRLGIEDFWQSGVGGTGFVNPGAAPRARFGDRIADIVDFRPDIVVVPGSVNDNSQASADVTAAVAAFWPAVRAALPAATLVAFDPWNAPASITAQSKYDALRAGVAAANAGGANVQLVQTQGWYNGVASWGTTAADNTHPEQQGHDWYGFLAAEALRQVLNQP